MQHTISLAPLQGFTDYIFRKVYNNYFTDIDKFYSPYIRLSNDKTIKKSQIRDILPENNKNINLIPQILVNNSTDFIFLSNYLFDFGYKEINWNLGCPYPMVAKRNLGAGLLEYPEKINEILETIINKIPNKLSIKMRLGNKNIDDIDKIISDLNNYNLSDLIIHPRIATQLYKGNPDLNKFAEVLNTSSNKITYNGDIKDISTFNKLENEYQNINNWMIGRGILANPFLASQIKKTDNLSADLKKEQFYNFHDSLFNEIENSLSGSSHILTKMTNYWEYFSLSFTNSHKVFKRIKKTSTIEKYKSAVNHNFSEENLNI
ncbi:MAG: tRNA-dihydrouridine synthase family protein [Bacteroidales bacterium]|nr:tRNA-dihydrouridine synthase family protein [Bacteroidales bacterium]MBN2756738.1 tRNA-dihydrouridine synthase family protein [Bacteroidales bacterium]